MSSSIIFWLIFGLVLIFLEFLLPGLVVIFLGLGAFSVALLQWLGLLDSITASITAWFISSLFFLIVIRTLIIRFFPGDVTKQGNLDEDSEAYGAIVEVVEAVSYDNSCGRIRFQGTTWSAKCIEGRIPVGRKAKIVFREDLTYVIEPYQEVLLEETERV